MGVDPLASKDSVRWVVHFGPPKTGTTSLQQLLRAESDLLSGLGVSVPTTGWFDNAHHGLPPALVARDSATLSMLRDEVMSSGCRVAVLTSENLFPVLQSAPEALTTSGLFAPGDTVQVVGHLRPLGPWLVSLWGESLRTSEGLWIDDALRLFHNDAWTRVLPILEGILVAGAATAPEAHWEVLALAPVSGDARSMVRRVLAPALTETHEEEWTRTLPRVNVSDSAWTALCLWLDRGEHPLEGTHQVNPNLTPRTAAGRRLQGEPLQVFLSRDDQQWLRCRVVEWVATEVEPLVAHGWLDPDEARLLVSRSREPMPGLIDDDERKALVAEATHDIEEALRHR